MQTTNISFPRRFGREWSLFQVRMRIPLLTPLKFPNDRNLPVSLFDIVEYGVHANQSDVSRQFVREFRRHIFEQPARAPEITSFFRGEREGELRRYVIGL